MEACCYLEIYLKAHFAVNPNLNWDYAAFLCVDVNCIGGYSGYDDPKAGDDSHTGNPSPDAP